MGERLMESRYLDPEDEAFNEIERQAKQRKEAVKAQLESQEPVAYINVEKRTLEWAKLTSWETPTVVNLPKISLYTHPPQRTWVDLTEVQIQNVYFEVLKEHRGAPMPWGQVQFGKAVLEKFKEKNT